VPDIPSAALIPFTFIIPVDKLTVGRLLELSATSVLILIGPVMLSVFATISGKVPVPCVFVPTLVISLPSSAEEIAPIFLRACSCWPVVNY